MNAPDPYRLREREWSARKRRGFYRPRRLDHLQYLEDDRREADRLRVADLPANHDAGSDPQPR